MGLIGDVYALLLLNLVLLEFLTMATIAWFWNGLATQGTGRYFGPFALLAAVILMASNVRYLGVMIPDWFLFATWTALALTGMRVALHMAWRVRMMWKAERERNGKTHHG